MKLSSAIDDFYLFTDEPFFWHESDFLGDLMACGPLVI